MGACAGHCQPCGPVVSCVDACTSSVPARSLSQCSRARRVSPSASACRARVRTPAVVGAAPVSPSGRGRSPLWRCRLALARGRGPPSESQRPCSSKDAWPVAAGCRADASWGDIAASQSSGRPSNAPRLCHCQGWVGWVRRRWGSQCSWVWPGSGPLSWAEPPPACMVTLGPGAVCSARESGAASASAQGLPVPGVAGNAVSCSVASSACQAVGVALLPSAGASWPPLKRVCRRRRWPRSRVCASTSNRACRAFPLSRACTSRHCSGSWDWGAAGRGVQSSRGMDSEASSCAALPLALVSACQPPCQRRSSRAWPWAVPVASTGAGRPGSARSQACARAAC